MSDRIVYTGSNAAEVRDWYHERSACPEGSTWLLSRSMSSATGGQAWRYVRADAGWPDSVRAAVWSPRLLDWLPLPDGSVLRVEGGQVWLGEAVLT